MVRSVLVLLGFQLMGEVVYRGTGVPLPGPVLGMAMLAGWLLWRRRAQAEGDAGLRRVVRPLLGTMGLFFVPAGVGVVASMQLLRRQWVPLVVGLLGSTVLSLVVTGLVMERVLGRRRGEAA